MTSVRTGAVQGASVWETLKQEIKAAGPELGIDDIGFAAADKLTPHEPLKTY